MTEATEEPDEAPEIWVRRAAVEDAERLADINISSWQKAYRGILPDTYLDGLSRERHLAAARWRTSFDTEVVYGTITAVAVDVATEAVIGFVRCGTSRDHEVGPQVGEVWAVYVHPDEWRTGTGSALMAEALAYLTNAGYAEAMLWVFELNTRARRFYEYHGFRHDGASTIFERGGGQAIELRYRKPLKS